MIIPKGRGNAVERIRTYYELWQWLHPKNKTGKELLELAALTGIENIHNVAELFVQSDAIDRIFSGNPFYPFPAPEEVAGPLRLGVTIPDGHTFGLSPMQITRNIMYIGAHGCGKTTSHYVLIKGLYELGIPFIIISLAKRNFRHLIRLFPEIQVIRAKDFRMNPLFEENWSNRLTTISDFLNIYSHETDVMQRSKGYIIEMLEQLWNKSNQSDNQEANPNLEDLHDLLKLKSQIDGFRKDDFILRNMQRIKTLLFLSEQMFRCSRGFVWEKLLERPVIIELEDTADDVINFFLIILLTKILRYRIEKRVSGKLEGVMFFDEAKRIFSNYQERKILMGVPPINYIISYSREQGQGFIVSDQEAPILTDTLKACTNTKLSFMVSGKNIKEIKEVFGLNDEQLQVVQQLSVGQAIVKMDERYMAPFPVQLDYLEVPKVVTEEEVIEHSRDYIQWLNEDVRPRSTVILERSKKPERNKILSEKEETFLISIGKMPELAIVERITALKLTKQTGNSIATKLENIGFIEKVKIYTGQKGRNPVIFTITSKGEKYLNMLGVKFQSKGRGGPCHLWWQKKIQIYYKALGKKAVIEPNAGKANADVLVFGPDGKRVAVEVALSHHNQVNNIKRDISYFDQVIVASETKALMKKIEAEARKILSKPVLEKVTFCLLKDFLEKDDGQNQ